MKGKLIVIEGTDGSGKATQTELIADALRLAGLTVNRLSFPDYDSDSSALIKMYLRGEFGTRPDDVNAYAASSFYAVDRYASFRKWSEKYEKGEIFIADRYTQSNAIYQCSKLPREKWDEFLQWLWEYEFDLLGIPRPDMTIYLSVPVEVSQKLMTARYEGDEKKKDIHEADVEFQRRCREAAEYCAEKYGWKVIECSKDREMLQKEIIRDKILEVIGKIF